MTTDLNASTPELPLRLTAVDSLADPVTDPSVEDHDSAATDSRVSDAELLELSADEIEVVAEAAAAETEQPPAEQSSTEPSNDSAENTKNAHSVDPPADASPDVVPALRATLLQRINESPALPRGIRGRLSSALQAAPLVDQGGQLLAPVHLLLDIVEQWSPVALRLDPRSLHRSDHPTGDSFFTGDPTEVSDEQAERIAREQLQRSGYLPRSRRT